MNDAGSEIAAEFGESLEAVEQGVDQGAGMDACSGVDDHAGGLVYGDAGAVFIKHGERDIFGDGFERCQRGGLDVDSVVTPDLMGGLFHLPVDCDPGILDPGLEAGTTVLRQAFMEKRVQPLTFLRRNHRQLHGNFTASSLDLRLSL